MKRWTSALVAVLAAAALSAATPRRSISFDGAFVKPQRMSVTAIAALPHVSFSALEEHSKKPALYRGVLLSVLLASAGLPIGRAVKGAPARSYVVVHAADGYAAVYSVAELDSTATRCAPLFADRRNGVAMSPSLGPFRLIAPCDRTHARWVHEVTGFTVVTVPDTKRR